MDKLAEGFLLIRLKLLGILITTCKMAKTVNLYRHYMVNFYSAMPATMVITAAYDPLHDEGCCLL